MSKDLSSPTLRAKAEVERQTVNLSNEGYRRVGAIDFYGTYSVVMLHNRNGNRMVISAHANCVDLKKNGKFIKQIVL